MMFDGHPDLRRYVSVTFFVSAGVGVFGVLFLILGLTGVHGSAKGPSWPFVIFGVVAILSCVGAVIGSGQPKAVIGAGTRAASSRSCFRRSAIRKASSSAWSALRRGSHSVS